MSEGPAHAEGVPEGVRFYTVFCLLALLAAALPLVARGLGLWALFPSVVGALAVAARWRAGPVLYLVALLWVAVSDHVGVSPWGMVEFLLIALLRALSGLGGTSRPYRDFVHDRLLETSPLLDMFLAVAVLAYAAAHYRLLGLTANLFPVDRRRRLRKPDPERPGKVILGRVLEQRRSPETVDPQESGPLILAATVCACVGQLLWLWLSDRYAASDLYTLVGWGMAAIYDGVWRMIVLLWLFSLLLIVATGVLAYLGQRRLTEDEAGLYLQDELWRQTRREQARLNRWLAWAVRRRRRREAARAARKKD